MRLFRKKRSKVALVLGGGSARGIAHIGVLRVLEREKVPIDLIVGTSMGAMIGAAYSLGVPVSAMEAHARSFTIKRLLDPTMPRMGLMAGEKLENSIRELIDSKTFAECKIPLAIVATDIEAGDEVVFREGDLVKILRASCSWPGIYNPVTIGGRLLCDGGIKHSVPTMIARDLGADHIVAVDVGFCVKQEKIDNIFQVIVQAFQITGEELNRYQSLAADSIIKVALPDDIDQMAFNRAADIIEKGAEAAEARIRRILKEIG